MEERKSKSNGERTIVIAQQTDDGLLHNQNLQSNLTVETEHPLQGEGAVIIAQQARKRLLHIKYLLSNEKHGGNGSLTEKTYGNSRKGPRSTSSYQTPPSFGFVGLWLKSRGLN